MAYINTVIKHTKVTRWYDIYEILQGIGYHPIDCPYCHCLFYINFWEHCPACGWAYLEAQEVEV